MTLAIEIELERRAIEFARKWYTRPPSGCDEETLAALLMDELRKQDRESRTDERIRIADRVSKFLHSS